jgi:hypothetical protein
MTRQPWWSPKRRSSSPDNGVDALTELTRLRLGSLHATACEVAHVRRTRSSGNSVPWVTPHTSLELPGRAARSRGRTSTGEFQSIHGILSGTLLFLECALAAQADNVVSGDRHLQEIKTF